MRTNADFGKFLFALRPQSRPALHAFYNFVRNFTDLTHEFAPEIVMRFYLKALSFEHWQKNILELTQDTKNVLEKFLGADAQKPEWKELRHADQLQIVKIKNRFDQLEMIKQFISQRKPQSQFQVFVDKSVDKHQMIAHAVIIYPEGNVQVLTFDDLAYIRFGQILPLNLNRKIEYTKKLELSPNRPQVVQISPFITAKFTLENGQITGDLIRGYTFQNFRKIDIHELHQEPTLLYAVKRIERFFIDRSSEPLYMELVGVLEQTIEFLRKDLDGSQELAQKAFARGKNALENIFIDDKMLHILLKEIHHLIDQKGQRPWNPSQQTQTYESTNSLPKLEYAPDEPLID